MTECCTSTNKVSPTSEEIQEYFKREYAMYYGKIIERDCTNGPGVRVTIFVSGCRNHCKGCFQPETWDFHYGEPFLEDELNRVIDLLKADYVDGLSLLGGDPFENANQLNLIPILKQIKSIYPDKTIWAWTGYLWEDLIQNCGFFFSREMLEYVDVLVDGPFVEELKDLRLKFRGSSNQRIINVKESLETKQVVLWGEEKDRYHFFHNPFADIED